MRQDGGNGNPHPDRNSTSVGQRNTASEGPDAAICPRADGTAAGSNPNMKTATTIDAE